MRIVRAETPGQLQAIRELFREYESFLKVDLCFQGFEAELKGLPGRYARPDGALYLALRDSHPAGCVALRKLKAGVCEMKRLYVRPAYRGTGLGGKLAETVIDHAKKRRYAEMWLDTLKHLETAVSLYRSLGFVSRKPYYDNPLFGVSCWRLEVNAYDNQ